MIKRKLKKCKRCEKDSYIFGKGLCKTCYNATKTVSIKKPIPIKKESTNQKRRTKKYLALRKIYLQENPICECCHLERANEIHHKAGRDGENLFKDFLAVCSNCHHNIEMNPEWAKENGYSKTRL